MANRGDLHAGTDTLSVVGKRLLKAPRGSHLLQNAPNCEEVLRYRMRRRVITYRRTVRGQDPDPLCARDGQRREAWTSYRPGHVVLACPPEASPRQGAMDDADVERRFCLETRRPY